MFLKMVLSLLPCIVRLILFFQVYVHRSGRTARASADGCSIALISPKDKLKFASLCKSFSKVHLKLLHFFGNSSLKIFCWYLVSPLLGGDNEAKAECSISCLTSVFSSLLLQETLQRFPVDESYMPEVFKRLSLTRQIDKVLRKNSHVRSFCLILMLLFYFRFYLIIRVLNFAFSGKC